MAPRSGMSSGRTRNGGGGKVGYGAPTDSSSYIPMADSQTFRDLLIFEERLKQSATRLQKRKKKYETLLATSCAGIAILSYYVFLDPPDFMILHRLNVSLLLFLSTVIFLFFASGMYSDRIVAANRFVPSANRSLRYFNMYLNTRTAPRRGLLARIFLPFANSNKSTVGPPSRSATSAARRSQASLQEKSDPSEAELGQATRSSVARSRSAGSAASANASGGIPPAANPRGELIFHSKVSPTFREGYERYRAAFERRRSERLEAKRRSGWRWWLYTGAGWGWWIKEIWRPSELEPTTAQLHHSHHSPAAGGSGRSRVTSGGLAGVSTNRTRNRSGTAGSAASSNSSDHVAAEQDDDSGSSRRTSRQTTPKRSMPIRTSSKRVLAESSAALQASIDHAGSDAATLASSPEAPLAAPIGIRSRRATGHDDGPRDRNWRGRDSTPTPVIASYSPASSLASLGSDIGDIPEGSDAPDAKAVAATADDRSDPVSTLREPEADCSKDDMTQQKTHCSIAR